MYETYSTKLQHTATNKNAMKKCMTLPAGRKAEHFNGPLINVVINRVCSEAHDLKHGRKVLNNGLEICENT